MPKRRIMRALKIKEISAVDRPAQAPALFAIMKRAGAGDVGRDRKLTPEVVADLVKRGRAILTSAVDGHTHLVMLEDFDGNDVVSGTTTWQDEHTHPWIMQEDGTILIGTVDDHTHDPEKMSKSEPTGDAEMTPEEKAKLDKLETSNTELTAKLVLTTALAALTDLSKAHYATLDEEGKTAFLAKSADEQKAELEAIEKSKTDSDPVVYTTTDGVELRKSDGVALIAMAKSNDVLRKTNEDLAAKAADIDLRKRVEDEFPHLKGTVEDRCAMLKAIDAIQNEDQRKAALGALKSQNEAMALVVKTYGTTHGGGVEKGSADDQLITLAQKYQKDHSDEGLTEEQAYSKVLDTKEGKRLYGETVNH